MLLTAFSLSIRQGVRLEYAGFFGLMAGIMTIFYGVMAYGIGLTMEPVQLLLMYFFYGLAGVFSYPVALIADRLPGLQRKVWSGWNICLMAFGVCLVIASLLAVVMGANAISAHLAGTP